jgi:hypothetical protein
VLSTLSTAGIIAFARDLNTLIDNINRDSPGPGVPAPYMAFAHTPSEKETTWTIVK